MKKQIRLTGPYCPANMSDTQRKAFSNRVFSVHKQIFDGVDFEGFRRYVIAPGTERTRIFIMQNKRKEDVGYLTCQIYATQLSRKKRTRQTYIYRTEVGILPAYRGSIKPFLRLLWELVRFSVPRGIPRAYFVATPINPLAYKAAERLIGELYPRPTRRLSPQMQTCMQEIANCLQLKPAAGSTLTRYVGWQVRFSANEIQRLNQSQDPAINYYLKENPGFQEGNGLMMVAPGTLRNAWLTLARMLKTSTSRTIKSLRRRASSNLSNTVRKTGATLLTRSN